MIQLQPSLVLKKSKLFLLLILLLHGSICALNMGPAIDINNSQAIAGTFPEVSINNNGIGISVWMEENAGIGNIYSRVFNGIKWADVAIAINNNQSQNSASPQISLGDNGAGIAVWLEFNAGVSNTYARVFDGSNWALVATNLNNNQAMGSGSPQISVNDTSNAMAVWEEQTGGVRNIYAREFNGASWLGVIDLNNTQTADASNSQVSINNTGTAVAVWQEQNGNGTNVYARVFDGTNWALLATDLNNIKAASASIPQISLNNDGTAIAVWVEQNGNALNIYARVFDGTNWAVSAIDLNNNILADAFFPQISVSNNGTAIAVWQERIGGVYNIYARKYDGTNWLPAIDLNNDTTSEAEVPQISIKDDGTGIADWIEANGGIFNIYARAFDGTGWSGVRNLNYDQTRSVNFPHITDGNNLALAVWSENTGSVFNVFARQTALPYYFSQWNSPVLGTQQYISAVRTDTSASYIDIYSYAPTTSVSTYITSITLSGTVDHFAVYNKSDTELYYVVITHNPETLTEWLFNGSTVTQVADLSSQVIMPTHDAQWWAPSATQTYVAAIGDVDVSVLDLVNIGNSNALGAQGQDLLWTTTTNYTGLVVLNNNVATPYKVDLTISPIGITAGTGVTAPTGFTFTALSTCGDYIAVGLSSTDTTAYGDAQVALLNLDATTNMLSMSSTTTTLFGQIAVESLARCCCCATERPLIAGSFDVNGNYNINVYEPDLTVLYASTLLGNDVKSVAWSCQGENRYLTASSLENNNDFQYTVKYTFSLDGGTLSDLTVVTH